LLKCGGIWIRGKRSEEGGVVGGDGEMIRNSSSVRSFEEVPSKLDFRRPPGTGPPNSEPANGPPNEVWIDKESVVENLRDGVD